MDNGNGAEEKPGLEVETTGTDVRREAVKDVEFVGVLIGPAEGTVVFANGIGLDRGPVSELLPVGTTLPVPNEEMVEFSTG